MPEPLRRLLRRLIESSAGGLAERWLTRRAELRVRKEKQSFSKEALLAAVREIPWRSGDVVFVHSSLKAIGYVEGGPLTVVDVLRRVIVEESGGTLAMSAISFRGSMASALRSAEPFDADHAPVTVGAIPETFRRLPGVLRSIHPTHSVCALGAKAQWLTEDHHRCGSTFGPGSPYARLLEADGLLAGLGTDLGPVTFYHVIEETLESFPVSVYTKDSPIARGCVVPSGEVVDVPVMAHAEGPSATRIDTVGGEWIRAYFTGGLQRRGSLNYHKVGMARAWTVRARDLYAYQQELLARGITIYSTQAQVEEADFEDE